MALTDKALKNLRPSKKRYEVPDRGDGLSVRVTPKNKKTFQFRFRFEGKQQRIDYGNYPEISLKQAREQHDNNRKLLEQGINPSHAKKADADETRNMPTVKELLEEYDRRFLQKELRRPRVPRRLIEKDIIPIIGHKKVKGVTPSEVDQQIIDIHLHRFSLGQGLRQVLAHGGFLQRIESALLYGIAEQPQQRICGGRVTDVIPELGFVSARYACHRLRLLRGTETGAVGS
jgi:hypothetical protein